MTQKYYFLNANNKKALDWLNSSYWVKQFFNFGNRTIIRENVPNRIFDILTETKNDIIDW